MVALTSVTTVLANQEMRCPQELNCDTHAYCTYDGGNMNDWYNSPQTLQFSGKFRLDSVILYRDNETNGVKCSYLTLLANSNSEIHFIKDGNFGWPGMPISKGKWRLGAVYKCAASKDDCVLLDLDK
jgi:hypothetical protein